MLVSLVVEREKNLVNRMFYVDDIECTLLLYSFKGVCLSAFAAKLARPVLAVFRSRNTAHPHRPYRHSPRQRWRQKLTSAALTCHYLTALDILASAPTIKTPSPAFACLASLACVI